MSDSDSLDFYAALGDEFCDVLASVVTGDICGQDGYEVFSRVLGDDFEPADLIGLTAAQVDLLQGVATHYLDSSGVTRDQIEQIVRRTLWRVGS